MIYEYGIECLHIERVVGGQGLQIPLGLEVRLQRAQLIDNAIAGVFQGVLGVVALGGLYSQLEAGKEGMLHLVGGKQHLPVIQQLCANQVAQRVVLLLERDHHGVGGLGVGLDL